MILKYIIARKIEIFFFFFCHLQFPILKHPEGALLDSDQKMPLKYTEFIGVFMEPVKDTSLYMTWDTMLEETNTWFRFGYKEIHMVSNNIQIDCDIQMMLDLSY